MKRDSIANSRDRAAVERDAAGQASQPPGRRRDRSRRGTRPSSAPASRPSCSAPTSTASPEPSGARWTARAAQRDRPSRRADGKFVIAYIDVDGLKGVNDRNGHAAGDRVLRMLVATMRANLRSYDPIVRFGGDEFVCGIASIDPGEVQHRIGVIDQSMRSATGVGITGGLAELRLARALDDLTARADAALIAAKQRRGE